MDIILCIILILLSIPIIRYFLINRKNPKKVEEIESPYIPSRIKIERGTVSKCIGVSHCHADIGTITALQVVSPNYKILPFKKIDGKIQEEVGTKLKSLNPKCSKHYIQENWNGSDIFYVMISNDDRFIGTVAVDRKNFEPYISHLYVDPLFRHKGYGERLLEHGIEYAKLFKFDNIKLWCEEKLIGFYSKKGWIQEKPTKDNNGNDVWIMSYKD
jgi:predicted GNAT family acetyltransferase